MPPEVWGSAAVGVLGVSKCSQRTVYALHATLTPASEVSDGWKCPELGSTAHHDAMARKAVEPTVTNRLKNDSMIGCDTPHIRDIRLLLSRSYRMHGITPARHIPETDISDTSARGTEATPCSTLSTTRCLSRHSVDLVRFHEKLSADTVGLLHQDEQHQHLGEAISRPNTLIHHPFYRQPSAERNRRRQTSKKSVPRTNERTVL